MKNYLSRMSRRERLYLLAGAVALFIGLVVYPAIKKAGAYHEEQQALLADESALLEDLYNLFYDAPVIEEEYDNLSAALHEADDLLFPPIENPILTQTAMIRLFNELGPDLELETTSGRSSVGDAANQMNLSVRGQGRYPEILKFMHRLESYRPLILVESFTIREERSRRGRGPRGRGSQQASSGTEPNLALYMQVQIICQEGGES